MRTVKTQDLTPGMITAEPVLSKTWTAYRSC